MYLRCRPEDYQLGAEVGLAELDESDGALLGGLLSEYYHDMDVEDPGFGPADFVKVYPRTARPYGTLYAY
jgi:hypothetical protein